MRKFTRRVLTAGLASAAAAPAFAQLGQVRFSEPWGDWRLIANGWRTTLTLTPTSGVNFEGSMFGDPVRGYFQDRPDGDRRDWVRWMIILRGPPANPFQMYIGTVSQDMLNLVGDFYALDAGRGGATPDRNHFSFRAQRLIDPPQPLLPGGQPGLATIAGPGRAFPHRPGGGIATVPSEDMRIVQAPNGDISGFIGANRGLRGHYAANAGTVAFVVFEGAMPLQIHTGNTLAPSAITAPVRTLDTFWRPFGPITSNFTIFNTGFFHLGAEGILSGVWRINGNGRHGALTITQTPGGRITGQMYSDDIVGHYSERENLFVLLRRSGSVFSQAFVGSVTPDGSALSGQFYALDPGLGGSSVGRNTFSFGAVRGSPRLGPPIAPPPLGQAAPIPIGVDLSAMISPSAQRDTDFTLRLDAAGGFATQVWGKPVRGTYGADTGTLAYVVVEAGQPAFLYLGRAGHAPGATTIVMQGNAYRLTPNLDRGDLLARDRPTMRSNWFAGWRR